MHERKPAMIYAHIYKARKNAPGKFELLLTATQSLCQIGAATNCQTSYHATKLAAKAAAKAAGAIPHNYT